jgi:hypothetical protein
MTAHPKPKKPPWRIDPSIDVNRVSLEDVQLIFSQAEKRLADTIKRGESIESKTMTMVGLMTGTLITLCGYVISSLFLYMSEIENYNLRIQLNLEENTRNLRRFRLSMSLLLILPIFLGVAFRMIQWLT